MQKFVAILKDKKKGELTETICDTIDEAKSCCLNIRMKS
jgi:hypothetical protein